MKKALLASLIASPLIFGCMSTSDNSGNLDRAEAVKELTTEMDKLGYEKVTIQPGIDEFLNITAAIVKRQRNVMGEYYLQTENYPDVQSFLYAHKDKKPEELKAAVAEFDDEAADDSGKIGPKIASYKSANEKIYGANMQLAGELTVEIAKSALILSQYGTEVAQATALNATGSFLSSFSGDDEKDPKNLGTALLKAKDQLALAMEANDIITGEQKIIEEIEKLQAEHEAKG